MTTSHYRRETGELRDLREFFYRTRLDRGDRLTLEELHFLYQRATERAYKMIGDILREFCRTLDSNSHAAIAFNKAMAGLALLSLEEIADSQ